MFTQEYRLSSQVGAGADPGRGTLLLDQETVDRLVGRRVYLTVEAMAALMLYPWPGGEEELRESLRQARLAAGGHTIELAHLPPAVRQILPDPLPSSLLDYLMSETERHYLHWVITESRLPKKQIALRLGVTRSALYKKLGRHGIEL